MFLFFFVYSYNLDSLNEWIKKFCISITKSIKKSVFILCTCGDQNDTIYGLVFCSNVILFFIFFLFVVLCPTIDVVSWISGFFSLRSRTLLCFARCMGSIKLKTFVFSHGCSFVPLPFLKLERLCRKLFAFWRKKKCFCFRFSKFKREKKIIFTSENRISSKSEKPTYRRKHIRATDFHNLEVEKCNEAQKKLKPNSSIYLYLIK